MSSQNFDMNRFLSSIPIITKIILGVNISVCVINFLLSENIGLFAISAKSVIYQQEYYRIVSSAFVHSGIMHIFMNMSTLLQLGIDVERQFGSLSFLFLTLWSILIVGILYCLFAWSLASMIGQLYYLEVSAVGYSGILFAYAVIEAFHSGEATRSIFGMFSVPSKLYPFILLILLQFIMPNISFFGHFSGVVFGLAAASGMLVFLLPSSDALITMESWSYMSCLYRNSSFVRDTGKSYTVYGSGGGSIGSTIYQGTIYILTMIRNIIYTILYIFGCSPNFCLEKFHNFYQGIVSFMTSLFTRSIIEEGLESESETQLQPSEPTSLILNGRRLVDTISVLHTNSNPSTRQSGEYTSIPTDEESGIQASLLEKKTNIKKNSISSTPQTVNPMHIQASNLSSTKEGSPKSPKSMVML